MSARCSRLLLRDRRAAALAFAADFFDDVLAFARDYALPVELVPRVAVPDGRRIKDGTDVAGVAQATKDAVRQALRETRATRVHLFQAAPAGLALLLGHRWNRVAPTVLWEDLGVHGNQQAFQIAA